ncbi:MAG: hypothetical protein HPY59_03240 [Anaerolineae bacterium]|nr:hypothetical protein [Anaerolineae bacterium]
MKREELKNLLGESATDGLIDKIMELHGKSVEKHKTDIAALTSERDGLKIQLVDAAALLRTNLTHPFTNRSCATVSNHFAESFPSPVLVSRPVLRYF